MKWISDDIASLFAGKARKDVENFLENTLDMDIFSKENILKLLRL